MRMRELQAQLVLCWKQWQVHCWARLMVQLRERELLEGWV